MNLTKLYKRIKQKYHFYYNKHDINYYDKDDFINDIFMYMMKHKKAYKNYSIAKFFHYSALEVASKKINENRDNHVMTNYNDVLVQHLDEDTCVDDLENFEDLTNINTDDAMIQQERNEYYLKFYKNIRKRINDAKFRYSKLPKNINNIKLANKLKRYRELYDLLLSFYAGEITYKDIQKKYKFKNLQTTYTFIRNFKLYIKQRWYYYSFI